jgi:hypothetical protein
MVKALARLMLGKMLGKLCDYTQHNSQARVRPFHHDINVMGDRFNKLKRIKIVFNKTNILNAVI